MNVLELALAAYAVGVLADIWTTKKVLDGGGRELNPVIRKMMDVLGDAWPLGKLALNGFAGWVIYTQEIVWLGWAAAAFSFALAINNSRHVR